MRSMSWISQAGAGRRFTPPTEKRSSVRPPGYSSNSRRPSARICGRRQSCTRNGPEPAWRAITSFPKQQELNRDAGAALLDKIGPAILLTHSQSGAFGWPIADARPNLVKAIVAVEPSGPPVRDAVFKGAPDYFSDGPQSKPWGLAAVKLTYGGVSEASQLAFAAQDKADRPDLMRCWRQKEPAHPLTNLQRIPVVIVSSEASYHASYDHCTSQYLAQAGVKNTFIRLADRGIKGNGHMMMLEKNNLAIAAVIADWLKDIK